ncbi:MAG: YqhA family protein [Pseudomonadales bacterium]
MIERIFQSSRFLVVVAVVATSVAAGVLYYVTVNILAHLVWGVVQNVPTTVDGGKSLAVDLLKLLDLLFIAITFHLMAVSLYRLFITPLRMEKSTFLRVLKIGNFHDLKVTLIQVSVVIMVILFLERAVESEAALETLYFGAAIGLVMVAAVYAWKNMK